MVSNATLELSRIVQVFTFDLGEHQYVRAAYEWVSSRFPGRINLTLGDSTQQVPLFAQVSASHASPFLPALLLRS